MLCVRMLRVRVQTGKRLSSVFLDIPFTILFGCDSIQYGHVGLSICTRNHSSLLSTVSTHLSQGNGLREDEATSLERLEDAEEAPYPCNSCRCSVGTVGTTLGEHGFRSPGLLMLGLVSYLSVVTPCRGLDCPFRGVLCILLSNGEWGRFEIEPNYGC